MATIASLLVNLGLNSAGFASGAKKARTSLRSLAEGAVALNSAIGIARAGGEQINKMFDMFEARSESIDNIGKLSDRLGFATEDLVALQHAANLSGVSAETLEGALQKMSVNLARANQGESVAEAFDAMGLSAQKLIDQNPMSALGQIADALNRLPTPAEKSAMAVEIFGKSGAGLVTVLQNGSAGLAEARAEAEKFGITYSRVAALQVEAANDAMTRAKTVVTGLGQSLVIQLAPFVEASATTFRHFVNEVKQGNVLFGYTDAVRKAANEFNSLNPTLSAAADNQRRLADSMDKVTESRKRQAQQAEAFKKFYIDLADRSLERLGAIEEFFTPLERLAQKRSEIAEMLSSLESDRDRGLLSEDSFAVQKEGLDTALARLDRQRAEAEVSERDSSFLGQIRKSMESPLAKYKAAMAKIEEELGGGLEDGVFSIANPLALEKQFAELQARRTFLEETPAAAEAGGERAAALERGSAAAFSASFGSKPVDKVQAEIKRLQGEMLRVMQSIEQKLTGDTSV